MSSIFLGCAIGFVAWFLVRYLAAGIFTVNQNERAVKTSFGRAERIGTATTLDNLITEALLAALETQKIVEGEVDITLVPPKNELLAQFLAAAEARRDKK